MIDLADAPVIDNHCHPWRNEHLVSRDPAGFEERITMMGMCLMSSGLQPGDGDFMRLVTGSTPLALIMRRRLAARFGCEPTRDAVADARFAHLSAGPAAYVRSLMSEAGIIGLVYDEGYPQPTIPREAFAANAGTMVHRVVRIEPLISALLEEATGYDGLEDAFVAELDRAASDPEMVAYKTIIAYRTGLDVGNPSHDERHAAFERWRADGFKETRQNAKPVRDALLQRTIEAGKRHGKPVHIHCGGGDPDILLDHATPHDLFPLLVQHADHPIVLIHSGWPWVEEAAYIASVLPNVYLDVSVIVPWTSLAIDGKLEVVLGAAPPAKLLYGSDESTEPEVIWLSAQIIREALQRVLTVAVDRGWLDEREGRSVGMGLLCENTQRLHRLEARVGVA